MDIVIIMSRKRSNKKSVKATPSVQSFGVASTKVSITNEGLDREMTVTGRTVEGTSVQVSTFKIIQKGLREGFELELPEGEKKDPEKPEEEYWLYDKNGEEFLVLKE